VESRIKNGWSTRQCLAKHRNKSVLKLERRNEKKGEKKPPTGTLKHTMKTPGDVVKERKGGAMGAVCGTS